MHGFDEGGARLSSAELLHARYESLNLPPHAVQLIADRATIDEYQSRRLEPESGTIPIVPTKLLQRASTDRYLHAIKFAPDPDLLNWRRSLPTNMVPAPGFRAPILGRAREGMLAGNPGQGLAEVHQRAAAVVTERLARDGLLLTLAKSIEVLGPKRILADAGDALQMIRRIGFPADLLACFAVDGARLTNASAVVQHIARKLAEGRTAEALRPELGRIPFRFVPADERFKVADESGAHPLGLLRMQAGGGYQGGVVAGGSIDVIGQLVNALPQADFLISIPDEFLDPFVSMARHSWRLRRTNQATVIGEPLPLSAWAQDNGKAGVMREPGSTAEWIATLTPRYASIGEGVSSFEPGESFLMDGLAAAGHRVAHSSLLFQGGNLLAVTEPVSGERVLLMSDGTMHRNMALGLSRDQVLDAFQSEFGVSRCVVLPAVSYHLDFDVSIRSRGKDLVVFVNDTLVASRIVVALGIDALERHGVLGSNVAIRVRSSLAGRRDDEVVTVIESVLRKVSGEKASLPASLSKAFVADRMDFGAGNLQTFLLAVDLLESSLASVSDGPGDAGRREYLDALRRLDAGRRHQTRELRKLGWTVVAIPSMTDLYRGINYLNGIQHRDGYIMPVFGGFYTALDQAAHAAFREAIGPDVTLTPVRSAECQRKHGGVHCTASAYPRL